MRRYLIGCLAAIALAMPVAALASFSNMYVFGDSLSGNGNLYGWTGAPNPVTGGIAIPVVSFYAPGRFQNGPSYSEMLWSQLQSTGHLSASGNLTARGLNPVFPSAIDTNPPAGTNYAVGGARSRYHRFDLLPPAPGAATFYPFSLRGQFDQYAADVGGIADSGALFVVWSGSNDIADAVVLAGSSGPAAAEARKQAALDDLEGVLGGLVAAGAEYLLVPNLPDLGLFPEVHGDPQASALATSLSAAYNAALGGIFSSLFSINSDLSLYTFDSFGLFQQLAASPGSYGFTDVTTGCLQGFFVAEPTGGPISVCGDQTAQDQFLFWDINHPTTRTHQLLAAGMRAAVPEPASGLLVGVGLGLLLVFRLGGHLKARARSARIMPMTTTTSANICRSMAVKP